MASEEAIFVEIMSQLYDKAQANYKKKTDKMLHKMIDEIEHINPVDYGYISSYEGHRIAKEVKNDILEIIHKYIGQGE